VDFTQQRSRRIDLVEEVEPCNKMQAAAAL
jgi:hypothetical protein